MGYSASSPILSRGTVSAEAIDAWFAAHGTPPPGLGAAILAACLTEGVNSDLVAAQCAHESAYWTSPIAKDKNNPAGIGAENDDPYGKAISFPSVLAGIQGQVDHLLTYCKGTGYWTQYDPRYLDVKQNGWLGSVHVLRDLEQKWAYTDPAKYAATPESERYGAQVAARANALVDFANHGSWNMHAEIPGFTWYPADANHYDASRDMPIHGGAQHFSDGTDSKDWLSRTSSPPVSAHFLIKRGATLADRGYQFVRLSDTAWTTNASNPFLVAIEYEHTTEQDIPDGDYEVIAQTWVDVAAEVARQGLGAILLDRSEHGIRGHREWTGDGRLCPDGLDVDRIVGRAAVLAELPPPAPPPATEYVNGVPITAGFLGLWRSVPEYAQLYVFGPPQAAEMAVTGIPSVASAQRFQRCWFIFQPNEHPQITVATRELWSVLEALS